MDVTQLKELDRLLFQNDYSDEVFAGMLPFVKEVSLASGGGSTLGQNTMPFNQAGVPTITLPVGCTTEGLPVGIQLVSGAFLDMKLLAIATLVERSIQFDTTPPILKTLEAVA